MGQLIGLVFPGNPFVIGVAFARVDQLISVNKALGMCNLTLESIRTRNNVRLSASFKQYHDCL